MAAAVVASVTDGAAHKCKIYASTENTFHFRQTQTHTHAAATLILTITSRKLRGNFFGIDMKQTQISLSSVQETF